MIHFRDTTFCTEQTCANSECHRRWTDELRKEAEAWWKGENPPVSLADLRGMPLCPGYIPQEDPCPDSSGPSSQSDSS